MMTEELARRPRWVGLLLVILPLWLVVSGGGAMWYFLHRDKKLEAAEQERFSRSVSATALADDVRKLVEIVGERNSASEKAAKNLTRAASMIEGSLGPSNIGFAVNRTPGPADWPLLHVRIQGKNADAPGVWIVCAYDSRSGSPGAEANATGVAASLAAAQALAGEKPPVSVHFAFVPHGNDPDSPVVETARKFAKLAGKPSAVLCVEAMGSGGELWLSSRDTAATPLAKASGLGSVKGAEVVCIGDGADLSTALFQIGLPAVRVATRPLVTVDEKDTASPSATRLAASTGRLVELIRRCASPR
jgi:hypothetical protein